MALNITAPSSQLKKKKKKRRRRAESIARQGRGKEKLTSTGFQPRITG